MKKHCVAKAFSYKFVFINFLCFLTNQKQDSSFQQVGGLATINISVFLFIASCALLQSHTEFNRCFIKEFSYMLFLL